MAKFDKTSSIVKENIFFYSRLRCFSLLKIADALNWLWKHLCRIIFDIANIWTHMTDQLFTLSASSWIYIYIVFVSGQHETWSILSDLKELLKLNSFPFFSRRWLDVTLHGRWILTMSRHHVSHENPSRQASRNAFVSVNLDHGPISVLWGATSRYGRGLGVFDDTARRLFHPNNNLHQNCRVFLHWKKSKERNWRLFSMEKKFPPFSAPVWLTDGSTNHLPSIFFESACPFPNPMTASQMVLCNKPSGGSG